MPNRTATLASLMVITSLTFAACQKTGGTAMESTSTPQAQTQTQTTTTSTSPTVTTTTTATGKELATTTNYQSPAGNEKVGFTIDVDANGVITDAKTQVFGLGPTSVKRQTSFAEGLPAVIKGKKLSDLTAIDRVGGSSLTTGAFNDALAAFKAKI